MNVSTPLTPPAKSILLVDDDRLILSTLTNELSRAGYKISTAESVDKAEAWLEVNEWPDLVLLDVRMPSRSGLEAHQTPERVTSHSIYFAYGL